MIYMDISDAAQWDAHTDWLNNPADEYDLFREGVILDFSVQEPGRGMKWSRRLRNPINLSGTPYVVVEYRAEGISSFGDYFLYLNGKIDGSMKELYVIMPDVLESDGCWRKVLAEIPPINLEWMAIQVQAKTTSAHIQIKSIAFLPEKPTFLLLDTLNLGVDWSEAVLPEGSFDSIDLKPYCNADVRDKLPLMELESRWLKSEQITADGIPFQVILGSPNVISTGVDTVGEFAIPIGKETGAIYLLLGAYYQGDEEPSIGSGKLKRVKHVERFVVEIEYADGVKDFAFPSRVNLDWHIIEAGIRVYSIVPTRRVAVKEIRIHDRMKRGEFYLAGMTIEKGFREETQAAEPLQPIQPDIKAIVEPDIQVHVDGDKIALNNGYLRAVLTTKEGLALESLENGYADASCLSAPSPIFAVKLDNEWVASSDFQVTDISVHEQKNAVVSLKHGPIGAKLTLSFNGEHQLKCALELTNLTDAEIKFTPSFLHLKNVFISNPQEPSSQDDQWYCFPKRGSVINNTYINLDGPYSGLFPLQFMDVYHPKLGGIYVMKQDLSDEYKWFKLKKNKSISLKIDYMEKQLEPRKTLALPELVIGSHAGDWHDALTAYQQWVKSWYKPRAPRKQWYREIFNFRQHFMHFALPRKSGMFDNETKQYNFREVIKKDIEHFGGIDYLHIFDWGWSKEYGRCGDYDHWEQIGGSEAFRKAIEGVQKMGIPVGLYVEGYLVDPQSNIGKAHGEEWQLLDPNGKPYTYFAPSYNMCPAVSDWQEHISRTCARVWQETGANGFYIDEMGFADPGHFCYNPNHGHPIPEPPLRGQCELMRKVRKALPPEVAVYSEESPADVNSQYQDGSFTYAISSVSDDFSPTHVNLYRFALPDFKTFEIITCDHPIGGDYQSIKRIFFNGEGIWIEGIAEDWFTPETRAFIAKMNGVMKAHVKAFTSLKPIPLVQTLIKDIYANEFPADEETVWTLYNARYSTVRGEMLAVAHKEGASYYDAWNGKELSPRIHEGFAYIYLETGPRDVGCVVQRVGK